MRRLLVVLAVVALGAACSWPWNSDISGPTQDTNISIVIGATPAPSATPTAPTGTLTPPAYVKVVAFGCDCPGVATCSGPEMQVGCQAHLTCTPKRQDGTDQTPAEHGPIASWVLTEGTGVVDLDIPENTFNRDATARAVGAWSVSCTVQGVTGSFAGAVK